MTGQVKEEILARFGELGIRVQDGAARIDPSLLRSVEFSAEHGSFQYLDVNGDWRELALPPARACIYLVPGAHRLPARR